MNAQSHGGITSLPEEILHQILRPILVVSLPLLIWQDPNSPVECHAPTAPRKWKALLLVNRRLGKVAAKVLYNVNAFHFLDTTPKQTDLIAAFFATTGTLNSNQIVNIGINFPVVERHDETSFTLREDCTATLHLLKEHCPRLRSIELHVQKDDTNGMTIANDDDQADPSFVRTLLSNLDAKLRADFLLLSKLSVKFYSGTPTKTTIATIHDLHWQILPK